MKTVNFTGTVSQATMHTQDLLPAFMGVLQEFHPKAHQEIASVIEEEYGLPCSELDDEDCAWRTEFMESILNEDVFDAMQEIAPEGYCFGASEGDGADFGFWPIEEERRQVYIDWDAHGYTVVVEEDGEEIYRYDAGNSPLESTAIVETDEAVGVGELETWARQTGREIAEEYDAHYNGDKAGLRIKIH